MGGNLSRQRGSTLTSPQVRGERLFHPSPTSNTQPVRRALSGALPLLTLANCFDAKGR